MDSVEIIGLPQSNFVCATRIACAEKGVPHTSIEAPPHGPQAQERHPFGRIPVLRHRTFALAESQAIARYIDRAFDGPPLMPTALHEYARAEQWLSIVVTTIEPLLVRQFLFAYLFPAGADGSPDRARIDALMPNVAAHLQVLERAVASGFAAGGTSFTLVDAFLLPILHYVRGTPEGGAAIEASPALSHYLDLHAARPSVASTRPAPIGAP
jgi:glutathione S-transferase